jgi:hypothetical protein
VVKHYFYWALKSPLRKSGFWHITNTSPTAVAERRQLGNESGMESVEVSEGADHRYWRHCFTLNRSPAYELRLNHLSAKELHRLIDVTRGLPNRTLSAEEVDLRVFFPKSSRENLVGRCLVTASSRYGK